MPQIQMEARIHQTLVCQLSIIAMIHWWPLFRVVPNHDTGPVLGGGVSSSPGSGSRGLQPQPDLAQAFAPPGPSHGPA